MARILILEDDIVLASQLQEVLELEHHVVSCFRDVGAALDFFTKNPVDIVISDIFIRKNGIVEKTGGITFIATIRQLRRSNVPIIAISGGLTKDGAGRLSLNNSKTVGANAVLAKPFHPEELLDLVAQFYKGS